jgi:hypothetical protein
MRKRIVLGVVALCLMALYAELLILLIGFALALPFPSWWGQLFRSHLWAVISWVVLCHTAAILLVALPFAYIIARLYGSVAIPLALAITVVLYAIDPLPAVMSSFVSSTTRMKMITLFDALKLLGALPCLVWLFARLTSNNRFERSRHA